VAGVEAVAPPRAAEALAPDDLQRIEGIGPKISGLLQAAGITTFAQLTASDVGRLEQIVREAGITIADPTTWPEQARLAGGMNSRSCKRSSKGAGECDSSGL
jgi:predicted flap endonuclease-1-like 5' DNA nuclease